MSRRIDYYFSLVSPWAYIGHRHFIDIAHRRDAKIAYKPVLLNNVFSETGGLPLAIALLAATVAPARAQSDWTGAVSSDWFTPGNWNPAAPKFLAFGP